MKEMGHMVHLLAIVIIQTPVYNPFYIVIRDNNLKIIENPLIRVNNHYEIDFELLAKQIDNRKILLIVIRKIRPGACTLTMN